MKRTLSEPARRQEILERLGRFSLEDQRQWGAMTVHGAVCHLSDSYEVPLGERLMTPALTRVPRGLYKRLALYTPTQWPQGVQTRPEVEQGNGGTPPGEFAADLARLVAIFERFCAGLPAPCLPHPIFGPMSNEDWMRWGYLHADHHLRQFGH